MQLRAPCFLASFLYVCVYADDTVITEEDSTDHYSTNILSGAFTTETERLYSNSEFSKDWSFQKNNGGSISSYNDYGEYTIVQTSGVGDSYDRFCKVAGASMALPQQSGEEDTYGFYVGMPCVYLLYHGFNSSTYANMNYATPITVPKDGIYKLSGSVAKLSDESGYTTVASQYRWLIFVGDSSLSNSKTFTVAKDDEDNEYPVVMGTVTDSDGNSVTAEMSSAHVRVNRASSSWTPKFEVEIPLTTDMEYLLMYADYGGYVLGELTAVYSHSENDEDEEEDEEQHVGVDTVIQDVKDIGIREIFDMQGRKIANTDRLQPGIYIEKTGSGTRLLRR